MAKGILLTLSAVGLWLGMSAQDALLSNDGAFLVIDPGATLIVQGGIQNINGGTIDNNGTLEVQGNFDNQAEWDSVGANTVIFSGGASSDVTSGGAVFDDVQMNKDAGFDINLMDPMTVKGDLTFMADNNKINLGANDLVMRNTGTLQSYDNNEYVVTDDVGYLRKQGLDASESFTFPVGNDASTYNPATIDANGGHTGDVISVRVTDHLYLDGLAETEPATEQAADAMWDVTEGTAGGSDVNLTLQWKSTDQLTNFPAEVGISKHNGTSWDMLETDISAPGGSDPYTQTRNNVTSFSAFAVGGEPIGHGLAMELKAFLQGAYSSGLMRDDLRSLDYIPTAEPYAGSPYNYSHTGFGGGEAVNASVFTPTGNDAIVDWALIELRDASSPTTILASKSGLIQRDGDIVDLDGVSPLVVHGLADGNYHIAVKHRNHLGVRTASAQALSSSPLVYDFSTSLAQVYNDGGIANDPMKNLGGGVYGLWGGDANWNNYVNYNNSANDKTVILQAVGITNPNNFVDGYHRADLTMNGQVLYNNAGNDKNFILVNVVGITSPNNFIYGHLQ